MLTVILLNLSLILGQPVVNDNVFNTDSVLGIRAEINYDNIYGWLQYDSESEFRVLGQHIGDYQNTFIGIGYETGLTNKLSVFGEVGWSNLSLSRNHVIQQEVAYTYLVGRHNVFNRPIPVEVNHPYDQTSYETEFDMESNLVFRLGAKFKINDNWSVSGAYKIQSSKTTLSIYDEEVRANGGGYWTESNNVDIGNFELKLTYDF